MLETAGWDQRWSEKWNELFGSDPQQLQPGRIISQARGTYRTFTANGEIEAEVAGGLLYRAESGGLPVTGDWVALRHHAGDELAIIHHVLPRRTCFSRRAAGKRVEEQVIASNIDVLFVVMAMDQDFNLRRMERYITAAGESGAQVVVLLNKADKCAHRETVLDEARASAGEREVVCLSAREDDVPALLGARITAG